MKRSGFEKARECGLNEKNNLVQSLRACEFCTDSIEELRSCYSETARRSGRAARECIAS